MTDNVKLSPRELQVITRIAMGFTESQIALDLGLARSTISRVKRNIRRKCETYSTPQAVYVVTMAGLIEMTQKE